MRANEVVESETVDEADEEIELMSMDEIAAMAMQGMLASGQYEDPSAAAIAAWTNCVPAFLKGRHMFMTQIGPMLLNGLGD